MFLSIYCSSCMLTLPVEKTHLPSDAQQSNQYQPIWKADTVEVQGI